MEFQPEENVRLAPYSTIEIGGRARWFKTCRHRSDLFEGIKWAKDKNLPVHFLGAGSNTLFSDQDYPGLVLHIATKGIEWKGRIVKVEAGELWDSFCEESIKKGYQGVECLSGIPGLVGATPIQNVGAYGQEVKNTIAKVEVFDYAQQKTQIISNLECGFSYRGSRFKFQDRGRFLILSVTFNLREHEAPLPHYKELASLVETDADWRKPTASVTDRLKLIRRHVLKLRADKGMVLDPNDGNSKSLGSFFMNPILTTKDKERFIEVAANLGLQNPPLFATEDQKASKTSAAWLIEKSGIQKGKTHGGSAVSAKHSLALINKLNATAQDVCELAALIQDSVNKNFGIQLEIEPQIIKKL